MRNVKIEDGRIVIECDDVNLDDVNQGLTLSTVENGNVEISVENDPAKVREVLNNLVPIVTRLQQIDRDGIDAVVGPEGM